MAATDVPSAAAPAWPVDWTFAGGAPQCRGRIRITPEDFVVEELPGYRPDGAGEHLLVQVRKRGANSEWVARQLAALCGLRPPAVGFAGLKDRHAVTTQWFSLHLGNRPDPELTRLAGEGFEALVAVRHGRKLRRGDLAGNRFRLALRELDCDPQALVPRLERAAAEGVPNYFGPQRFGRGYGNLAQADSMFAGARVRDRHRRGLYLSAARSYLFNRVLSTRVAAGLWAAPVAGDVLVDDEGAVYSLLPATGLPAGFTPDPRHPPSGPLWGRGRSPAKGKAACFEHEALADLGPWRDGLEHVGLNQERRALVLRPREMGWRILAEDALEVSFSLPAGAYATSVLREIVELREEIAPVPVSEQSSQGAS